MAEREGRQRSRELLDYIDSAPSPWHAVSEAARTLEDRGFRALREEDPWELAPGERYYVVRDGSSLVAFTLGERGIGSSGFRVVGAHTDSPGFRVKPAGAFPKDPVAAVAVEVYGGPILASFADRDLTLAGRVSLRDPSVRDGARPELVRFDRPLLRLPNLAIHMNREVNREGLKFDLQEQLPLFLGALSEELPPGDRFRRLVADQVGTEPGDLLSWSLAVADTQRGAFWGADGEFIADGQLDNLASCHAALAALPGQKEEGVALAALFDHEEVGSESYKGAAGDLLEGVLRRISGELELAETDYRSALARSWLISADAAHAYHPGWPRHHDEQHRIRLNGGPVIKINAAQRYATDDRGEAFFAGLCERVGVPWQRYVHRNDLPCGSTIGPMLAARLGLRTVDVGSPLWAMHSVRESAGADDHEALIRALEAFYRET